MDKVFPFEDYGQGFALAVVWKANLLERITGLGMSLSERNMHITV